MASIALKDGDQSLALSLFGDGRRAAGFTVIEFRGVDMEGQRDLGIQWPCVHCL